MSLAYNIWQQSATRLSLMMAGVFALILALAGLYVVYTTQSAARDYIDEGLAASVEDARAMGAEEFVTIQSEEQEFFALSQAYRAADGRIYGAVQPQVFAQSGYANTSTEALFDQDRLSTQVFPEIAGEALTTDLPARWRVLVAPLGNGQLAVFEPMDDAEEVASIILKMLAIAGAVVLGLTLALGLFLGLRQQRRINAIHAGIDALAQGDFSRRIAPDAPGDDLDAVAQGIDRAAERLEASFGQMRHFSQAVAHELRTPMARLRSDIEALPESPQAGAALEQSDAIIRIFENIARIARLSGTNSGAPMALVSLEDTARLIEELYHDVAADAGQDMVVTVNPNEPVRGDAQMLAQMASNLVENALRHAGSGARIAMTVAERSLIVSDTGCGVDEADLERMFTPFEQLGDRTAGTGLGLALVKAMADHMGARVIATSPAGEGLTVEIVFPAGDASD